MVVYGVHLVYLLQAI